LSRFLGQLRLTGRANNKPKLLLGGFRLALGRRRALLSLLAPAAPNQ
jgi:hypothetical protein